MYQLPPSPLLRRKSLATAVIPFFTKGNGPHEYGCVLAYLPEPAYSQIIDWGRRIVPDCDLGPDGREDRPHVTIKYGFRRHGDDTVRAVRRLLEQHGPIKIRLKGISLFEGNPGGDVLKIDVDSPELHKLNSILTASFPCIDKYRRYVPHVTIAYLHPGVSFKYRSSLVGNDPILHQTLELTELEWSGANGRRETIRLRGMIGFGPSPFGMRRKSLTVPYIKSGYFADCPRDRSGHCKPKNEGDESGQGRQEEQPRQGQQQEQPQQNQQQPQEKEPPAPDKPDPETGQLVEQMQGMWTQAAQAEENRDYLRMGKLRREAREMGQSIFRRLVTPAVAVRPGAVQFKPLSVDRSEWIDEAGVVRSAESMASVFYGIDPRDEDFDKKVEAVHDDARKELDALPEDFAQQKTSLKGKTSRIINALGAPDGSFQSTEHGEVLYWMTPGGHALLSTGEAGVVWPREKIDKIIKQNQRRAVRADKKALSYLDTTAGGALIPPPKKRRVGKTRLRSKGISFPHAFASRLRSKGWVTIGGGPCVEEGKRRRGEEPGQHCGGTPVYIEGGKITKGPKKLVGKDPDELSKKKKPKTAGPKTRPSKLKVGGPEAKQEEKPAAEAKQDAKFEQAVQFLMENYKFTEENAVAYLKKNPQEVEDIQGEITSGDQTDSKPVDSPEDDLDFDLEDPEGLPSADTPEPEPPKAKPSEVGPKTGQMASYTQEDLHKAKQKLMDELGVGEEFADDFFTKFPEKIADYAGAGEDEEELDLDLGDDSDEQPPSADESADKPTFPSGQGIKLKPIKELGGSTGAKLVEDENGNQFVQKKGANQDHVKEEFYADAAYRAAGFAVPESKLYGSNDGYTKLAQYIKDGVSLRDVLDSPNREEVLAQLRDGFVMDALMGNWDVIGASFDNILVSQGKSEPTLTTNKAKQEDPHKDGPWGGKKNGASYGGIMINDEGKIMLRKVAGGYGGYDWTWAKGTPDGGEHPADTSLREVQEELGQAGEIHDYLPGGYQSHSGSTAYFYLMKPKGEAGKPDKETEETRWVTPEEARELINQTPYEDGRRRDLEILSAVEKSLSKKGGETKVWRIDNGGSLRFRAQGAMKSDVQWGKEVHEIETLRDPYKNPTAASVFQGITDEQIAEQVSDLYHKKDLIMKALPLDARGAVAARLDWLKETWGSKDPKKTVPGSLYAGKGKNWPSPPPVAGKIYAPTPKDLSTPLFQEYDDDTTRAGVPRGKEPTDFLQHSKQFLNSLPKKEREDVIDYTGDGYELLNKMMRQCPETLDCGDKKLKKYAENVENAIASAGVFEKPVTAWRRIRIPDDELSNLMTAMEHALKSGDEVRMPGIKSLSINAGGFHGGNLTMEIKARTGVYVDPVSLNPGEMEILQGHNTRYRVVGIKEVPFDLGYAEMKKRKVIQLEEVYGV